MSSRTRCREIAAGFLYNPDRTAARVPTAKSGFVADLARADLADGCQVLIWTKFDEESNILAELPRDVDGLKCLAGKTPKDTRRKVITKFRAGKIPLLITKARLVGRGLNFQSCTSTIFSGFDDSFEEFYQAVRRCYRYGQTREARVHIPIIHELEGTVWAIVKEKEVRVKTEVHQQELNYKSALKELLS